MVGLATSVWVLALSRVVVGCVKQTMTASKAMAAEWAAAGELGTGGGSAAEYMALVSSAASAAWVLGSAVTGPVRQLHPLAPSAIALALYATDAAVVLFLLPPANQHSASGKEQRSQEPTSAATAATTTTTKKKKLGFWASCRQSFGNGAVGRFLLVKLLFSLVARSSMTMQDTWEMERFGLKAGQLGYLRTIKVI
jgi:hypothetical protein